MPLEPPPDTAAETLQKVFALAHQGRLGHTDMLTVTKLLVDAGNLPLATELDRIWRSHATSPQTHNIHLGPPSSQTKRRITTDMGRPLPANISVGMDVEAICNAYDAGGEAGAVAEVRARLGITDTAIAIAVVNHSLSMRDSRFCIALLFCSNVGLGGGTAEPAA